MNRLYLALTFVFLLVGQAHSFIIDDWNVTTGDSITDNTSDGNHIFGLRNSAGGTSLPRTYFMANLTVGDGVTTEDCVICQVGHFSNDAASEGHGYWGWGPASSIDLTTYSSIMLDISTDVDGTDIILSFATASNAILGEVWWKDLPATATTLTAALPSGLTAVDQIYLDVFSVGGTYTDPSASGWLGTRDYGSAATGLDLDVDNLMLASVPEPTTLALFGLGLAGIGYRRKAK